MTETAPGNGRPQSWIDTTLRAARRVEDGILVLVLAAMVGLAAWQIVLRNLLDSGLMWADPALRLMVLWSAMLGAMVATRNDRQITVDVLSRLLSARAKAAVRVLTDLFTAGIVGFLGWHSGRLVIDERAAGTVAFASFPTWIGELVLPVAFAVISLRYVLFAARHLRQALSGRTPT